MFLLGQRFEFMTFDRDDTLPTRGTVDETGQPATLQDAADSSASTGMFGAEYYESARLSMIRKYLPSYLVLAKRAGGAAFHVLFGVDVEAGHVRVITAYHPSSNDWEPDLKTRRVNT